MLPAMPPSDHPFLEALQQGVQNILTALAGKSNDPHGHNLSDTTGLIGSLALRPTIYQGAVQKAGAKLFCKAVLTVAGVAIFQLTDDGTAGGNALFQNVYDASVDFEVNDAANSYRYGWSLSADKKTLTVTVNRQAPTTILGMSVLGGLNPTTDGTQVRLTLWGD